MKQLLSWTALSLAAASMPLVAHAHAVAGDRIFPATLAVDDPGVGDELNFQFGHVKTPNDDGDLTRVGTWSASYSKLLAPRLAISAGTSYITQRTDGQPAIKGFDNLGLGFKYLLHVDPKHEFMLAAGIDADIGGTGSKAIGEDASTFTPTLYAGKGFGDLPESLNWLRPLAVTGTIGREYSRAADAPRIWNWGMTLQYSVPYLQSFVKNVGLPQPFAQLTPIVEAAMRTCSGDGCAAGTTGTINPGVIWGSRAFQLGLEAQIPFNRASGSGVGGALQVHFYFDDMTKKPAGRANY